MIDKLIRRLAVASLAIRATVVVVALVVMAVRAAAMTVTAIGVDLNGVRFDQVGDLLVTSGLVVITIISNIDVSIDGTALQSNS